MCRLLHVTRQDSRSAVSSDPAHESLQISPTSCCIRRVSAGSEPSHNNTHPHTVHWSYFSNSPVVLSPLSPLLTSPQRVQKINNNWFWKVGKGGWNSREEPREDRDREGLAGRCETLSVYACAGTAKGRRRMNLRATADYEVSRPHSYSGLTWKIRIKAAAFFYCGWELNPLQLKKTWIHKRRKLRNYGESDNMSTAKLQMVARQACPSLLLSSGNTTCIVVCAACSVLWMFVATCRIDDRFYISRRTL